MVSQVIRTLGEESFSCITTPEKVALSEYEVDQKSWKCHCCNEPVLIDAEDDGEHNQYIRLSVKDVIKGDYVYIRNDGFLEVLDAGKDNKGYFLAIKSFRKLTKLTEDYFCLVERRGRFILVYT